MGILRTHLESRAFSGKVYAPTSGRIAPNNDGSYWLLWKNGTQGMLYFCQEYEAMLSPLCKIIRSAQFEAASIRRFAVTRLEYRKRRRVLKTSTVFVSISPLRSAKSLLLANAV